MPNTEWPEKTEIRGLRLKVQPIDDALDIPDGLIPNLVLTAEGLREQLVWGIFPDVMFTDEN